MDRKECEQLVKGPGKFEGEKIYIPYFWDLYMQGFWDEDDSQVIVFLVEEVDRYLFPELKIGTKIRLEQLPSGRVREV